MNEFNYKKATQALVYFINKEKERKINKIKALKLLFFAERYHVRKYGRFITNDTYWAMKMGPVASGTKDLIDSKQYAGEKGLNYAREYIKRSGQYISAKNKIDYDVFSASDIESLDFAWKKFGRYNYSKIIDISHLYPEWKKHEDKFSFEGSDRFLIHPQDFLEEPINNAEACFEPSQELKEAITSSLNEDAYISSIWN